MKNKKHPFPMLIVAQSGSSVIVGGTGHTATAGMSGSEATDELEAELLRNFRALSVRGRVEVLQAIYDICEETKKPSTSNGRGNEYGNYNADSLQAAR